jgi:hypothetical protein
MKSPTDQDLLALTEARMALARPYVSGYFRDLATTLRLGWWEHHFASEADCRNFWVTKAEMAPIIEVLQIFQKDNGGDGA